MKLLTGKKIVLNNNRILSASSIVDSLKPNSMEGYFLRGGRGESLRTLYIHTPRVGQYTHTHCCSASIHSVLQTVSEPIHDEVLV